MENWSTTQTTLVLLLMAGFVCFVIYFGLNIKRVEKGKPTLGKALLGEINYSKNTEQSDLFWELLVRSALTL